MTSIKGYLLHIICSAILAAIIVQLAGKNGTSSSLIRLLAGLFLSVNLLTPVLTLNISQFRYYTADLTDEAQTAANYGTEYADAELRRIIISKSEAYIMDKAASLGVNVDVEVVLNEYTPQCVILKGAISPSAKTQLAAWISENLGIPKEAQEWI